MSVRIITDTRMKGLEALYKRVTRDRRRVLVGVPKGKDEADGTPIAMIAAVHEFGKPEMNIPERPALRQGILNNLNDLRRLNASSLRAISGGTMTMERGLGRLGEAAAGDIKAEIAKGGFEANAPSTVARKKSDKPLIDSGSYRQSITHVLDSGKGET
jgi:hypothetical protein